MPALVWVIGLVALGSLIGYGIRTLVSLFLKNNLDRSIAERIVAAREEAQQIIARAQEKSETLLEVSQAHETRLSAKEELLSDKQSELENRAHILEGSLADLRERELLAEKLIEARTALLEEVSGFDRQTGREMLLTQLESQYAADLQARVHKLDSALSENIKDRAKNILVNSIQRLAVPTATELATTSVSIPSDDIKGKIIGKEGRNIRVFERESGTELLVDETQGAIVVSSFDPVRRAIAVRALEVLITDGRIQPARIEEELALAREHIHETIKEKGMAAVYECGIYNFDPRLIPIIGRLHYRTSYGQNVLAHSIEMAHLAEMIASEVGADPYITKCGALVHDIGKALDHEVEGTHIDIGVKVLRRFGADERVITAMKSHHDDCPHETLEAVIVQTADMISGSRPGARRDTAELYLKRLAELERLASAYPGVEKAYALQAGREIRIFVSPEQVTDLAARNLARVIALDIESELKYPGQIKVTIIRETRIINYAR